MPARSARSGRSSRPTCRRRWARTSSHASIAEIVAGLPERSPKAMGQVMAALKARHGDALDSKTASGLVRAALS